MVHQQLLEYVQQQLQQGVSREQIIGSLKINGWQENDIDEVFIFLSNTPAIPQSSVPLKTKINSASETTPTISIKITMLLVMAVLVAAVTVAWMNKGWFTASGTVTTITSVDPVQSDADATKVFSGSGVADNATKKQPAPTQEIVTPVTSKPAAATSATSLKGGPNEILIYGRAAKGTILNANVRATEIINGKLDGIRKEVSLGPSGDFSVSMPKP